MSSYEIHCQTKPVLGLLQNLLLPLYFRCNVALSLLLPQITTMYPVLDCHLDNGRFHLHLLVYPFVYQFNSRTVALVYSSFANDYSSKRFQHYFNIISKFVCCVFYMKLECSFYTISFAVLERDECLSVQLPFELPVQIPVQVPLELGAN